VGVAAQAAHGAAIASAQAPAFGPRLLRSLERVDDVGRVARTADADHQVLGSQLVRGEGEGEDLGVPVARGQGQVVVDLPWHLRPDAMGAAAGRHQAGVIK
jgi:hypothetical protein